MENLINHTIEEVDNQHNQLVQREKLGELNANEFIEECEHLYELVKTGVRI